MIKLRKFLYNRFHPLVKYQWYERFKYGEWTLWGFVLAIHTAPSAEHSRLPIFDWEGDYDQ